MVPLQAHGCSISLVSLFSRQMRQDATRGSSAAHTGGGYRKGSFLGIVALQTGSEVGWGSMAGPACSECADGSHSPLHSSPAVRLSPPQSASLPLGRRVAAAGARPMADAPIPRDALWFGSAPRLRPRRPRAVSQRARCSGSEAQGKACSFTSALAQLVFVCY